MGISVHMVFTSGDYSVYLLYGAIIPTTDSIRDLGVLMDHELKFHEHTLVIITAKFTV